MSHDAAGAYEPHRGWSPRAVFNAYASVQRPVLETSAAKMESTNPTPPPLVHDGASSSRSPTHPSSILNINSPLVYTTCMIRAWGMANWRHSIASSPCNYRTRSNYVNIRTAYIIILFLSNSLNMLHLEFLTRSIRPNGHTLVQ